MIFETFIVISAAVIFVILARRLPDTGMENMEENYRKFNRPKFLFKESKFWLFITNIPKRVKKPNFKLNPIITPLPPKESVEDLIRESDSFMEAGDLRSAEKLYLRAVSKTPNNPKLYNRLGIIYLQQKNYADARDSFLVTLKFDDRIASRHYNLGLVYIGLGNNEKAKVSLKRAIELDPTKEKYQNTLKEIS